MKQLLSIQDVSPEIWGMADEWRLASPCHSSPFCTSEFAQLIGKLRDDVKVCVLGERDTPDLIWPLHISRSGWARPVGAPFSNRNGPLIKPGKTFELLHLFAEFGLSGMVAQGLIPQPALQLPEGYSSPSHVTDISKGVDALLAARKKAHPAHFKRLFRLERKLYREHPDATFNFDNQSGEIREQLIALQRRQLAETGRHNVLDPHWVSAMLDGLQTMALPHLKTTLSTLTAGDRLIAGELNIYSEHYMIGWIAAFNPEFGRYSPGNLLTYNIIKNMQQHGLTFYDAGPGNDQYKRYLANQLVPLVDGVFVAAAPGRSNLTQFARTRWATVEDKAPARIANTMTKIRRRADIIMASETRASGRITGFAKAAFPILNKPKR